MGYILSIAIPCYNSEAYMEKAIRSALAGGSDVEILIIDDGSSDGTAELADRFAREYPQCKACHQENGGHGAAVMRGLEAASGTYFRVLDSDDWLDADAFREMTETLRGLISSGTLPDLFVTDYLYDKVGQEKKRRIRYGNAMPRGRIFGFEEIGHLRPGQYILMHAATYRRDFLLSAKLDLPRHTFYVDNLYVYIPMQKVETLYYLPVPLYHYFIGRDDQSVHESVMIRRIDQQLRVNRLMMHRVDLSRIPKGPKRRYLRSYLEIITCVSSMMLLLDGSEEALVKRDLLWQELKEMDRKLYRELCRRPMGWASQVRTRAGKRVSIAMYHLADRIFGFN